MAIPHGQWDWAVTPSGGGDMENAKSLSKVQSSDV